MILSPVTNEVPEIQTKHIFTKVMFGNIWKALNVMQKVHFDNALND